MDELLEKIEAWATGLETFIEKLLSGLDKSLRAAERDLLRRLLTDVLPKFSAPDGRLAATARNLARLNLIDEVLTQFEADEAGGLTRRFAEELLAVAGRNADYYLTTGFDRDKVQAIAADTSLVRSRLGLTESGALAADGYLARLAKGDEVRQRLRDFVVQSFASKQALADFTAGLKGIVEGSAETEGALRQYWRQYAYDSYNAVREISNLHYANELKLNWFVYTGGVIPTSRPFCVKKNRKVFSREQAEQWRYDPDLIDKRTAAQYNPLIDRGRYNCRHFIMWISDEEAQRLRRQTTEPATRTDFSDEYDLDSERNMYISSEAEMVLDNYVPNWTRKSLVRMSGGIPAGDFENLFITIDNDGDEDAVLMVSITASGLRMDREIDLNAGTVYNAYFRQTEKRGEKLGAKMLWNQVSESGRWGIREITTSAARGEGFNGYYTWARVGYEFKYESSFRSWARAHGSSANTLGELMSTPAGRELWKEYGDTFAAIFKTALDFPGRETLIRYINGIN